MAYRFKRSESVPDGIKRIALEEIDSAIAQLTQQNGKKRDEAIHEARKSIKKIRGALRLVEPELGRAYSDENRRLRDIGRKLSQIRDAQAIIEVFESLLNRFNDHLQKDTLAPVRRGLEQSKQETEQAINVERTVQEAISTLRAVSRDVKTWPLKTDGFRGISQGLENTYRLGRKALGAAEKDSDPVKFHNFRKRVKDQWYQVRLLESLWTNVMQTREANLKDLETWLGDDHNLVVLRERLEAKPDQYGQPDDIQMVLTLANQYQNELREKAISLGQRLFEEKSRQFNKSMSKLWDAWQEQPDSMKQREKEQRTALKKQPAHAASRKVANGKAKGQAA